MRSERDAQLSLHRYVALLLPGYAVGSLIEQGTLERPYATVDVTTPASADLEGTLATRRYTQSFSIVAFPEPAEGESPYASRTAALAIEDRFYEGFQMGGIDGSRAMRVPLYDWDDATIEDVNNERTTKDFLRITDYSCRAVQSPSDETLFSVVCELRCQWSRAALLPETGPEAEEVRISFDAD